MLAAQLSEQPRSVHEVHGLIPNIMKFCYIVLCLYIQKMNRAVITNKLYVLSMSSNNTNHFVNTLFMVLSQCGNDRLGFGLHSITPGIECYNYKTYLGF